MAVRGPMSYQTGSGYEREADKREGRRERDGELRAAIDAALASARSGEKTLTAAWLGSPLGPMLALSNERALVLLEFLERRGLTAELERLSRDASIDFGRSEPIESIERELQEYFAGSLSEFATPIELAGTSFQLGVWEVLLKIPAGSTISYLTLAHRVGNPNGFRAVAQANGANRLAVIVPCHRVINSSGALGGYGAGLARKQWLLEHERAIFGGTEMGRLF